MADSVYDQTLDIAAQQIKVLVDNVNRQLIPEAQLEAREFDWSDINTFTGFSLRYDEPVQGQLIEDTNTSSNMGYPVIVVANFATDGRRDQRYRDVRNAMETIRRHYHFRRRFQDVCVEGVQENSCTVTNGGPTPPANIKLNKHVEMLTIVGWFMESRVL